MSITNNLLNILNETQLMKDKIFTEQLTITNINLSNSDVKKLEKINKTTSANIEIMNRRIDFLILKLINLFIFLFQNKNETKDKLLTLGHVYNLK
jgi:hypothetical protein